MSLTKSWMDAQDTASPTTKLEQARANLRYAIVQVQASEGRLLDYETADEITRPLARAFRTLEELTLTVAVMERRVNHV